MQAKLWTISELAIELDVDRRTIAKRLEGLEPDENEKDKAGREHRKYRLARVFAHLVEGEDGALKLDDERARLAHEQANRAEMENEVRRGELLDAAVVGTDIESTFNTFRQRLLSAPTKLAPLLNPEKPNAARDLVTAELERILGELHEHLCRAASGELRKDAEESGTES